MRRFKKGGRAACSKDTHGAVDTGSSSTWRRQQGNGPAARELSCQHSAAVEVRRIVRQWLPAHLLLIHACEWVAMGQDLAVPDPRNALQGRRWHNSKHRHVAGTAACPTNDAESWAAARAHLDLQQRQPLGPQLQAQQAVKHGLCFAPYADVQTGQQAAHKLRTTVFCTSKARQGGRW